MGRRVDLPSPQPANGRWRKQNIVKRRPSIRGSMIDDPTLTQLNRVRALLICRASQAYAPSRVREAASYLLQSSSSTEDEQRLATEAIEWLRSKRDAPKPAAGKQKRKGRA
jgi:hypothetical protein